MLIALVVDVRAWLFVCLRIRLLEQLFVGLVVFFGLVVCSVYLFTVYLFYALFVLVVCVIVVCFSGVHWFVVVGLCVC